jgi:cytochrome P450
VSDHPPFDIDIDLDPFNSSAQLHPDELRRMRNECPVARIPVGWYLSTQAEVLEAMRLVDTFVASFRAPGVVVPEDEKFINEIAEPRHGRVRKIINASVAHHKAMKVEPFIRDLCNEYFDRLIERGGGDMVADFVAPIPINVIAHLIGVPREDWMSFWRWSDEVVEGTYPTQYRNERGEGLAGAHPEFTNYVDALIAQRRSDPARPDDLLTRLLTTEIDGRPLSDVEVRTQLIFIIISGNETTRHLIANLMVTVASRPDLLAALRADRSLVERMVEESLRLQPPIHLLLRNVAEDNTVFGREMCVGEKIVFGIASANRDDTVHADADEFRLDRANFRDHVAFGGGAHVCPGSALARLEARVALETLLDRIESIEVEPDWTWRKTPVFWANGPVDLLVKVTPRTVPGSAI